MNENGILRTLFKEFSSLRQRDRGGQSFYRTSCLSLNFQVAGSNFHFDLVLV